MATDTEKTANKLRLTQLALTGLTKGVWEFVGETAFALTPVIGEDILKILEKEMGLEIHGENPEDVINEISRLFVDEFGCAESIDVNVEGDNIIKLQVNSCIDRTETGKLKEAGVTKPFTCPIMNACQAALKRMDQKVHEDIEVCSDGNCLITFEKV
ncbi:hypothetical protein GF337_13965 [candidate division KSB1 bacterium]|nr:hypothetical protein [candidate division KSB1 bacterium]